MNPTRNRLSVAMLLTVLALGAIPVALADVTEADKPYWQDRYQSLITRVASAKEALQAAENAYTKSRQQNRFQGKYRQEIVEARTTAQRELADAQQQLDAFPEEARTAGVPPGWLREVEDRMPAAPAD